MSTLTTMSGGLDVTIASATALPASGGFAVLRVAADHSLLQNSTPVLRIERYSGVRKLLPVEPLDGQDFGTASVDFLVPAMLLSSHLSLDLGSEIVPLPAVETAPAPAVDVAAAYLAQQDELVDLDERVGQLRAELRDASDRAAAAEDALSNATDRFETALIVQRREVGVVADELDDLRLDAARTEAELRNELAATEAELRGLLAEKDEEIERVTRERGELESELEATRARELDAADEHAAALATAHEAATAAEREVADLSVQRRRLEARLGTSVRARLDVEADRIADREAADRWLSMAIASRDMLVARVKELERAQEATAERPERLAAALAEARTMLREEREASERAYGRLFETMEERDELKRRVDALQHELQDTEARQRAQGEAAIRQLHTTLEAQRVASEHRIQEVERDAERRIAAAETPTLASILGVRNLDLDGLADVFAVADRARSNAERRGKFDFAQRWDALAGCTVDEAGRRTDPLAASVEKLRIGRARVGRFVRGRSARARAQLLAAAIERDS